MAFSRVAFAARRFATSARTAVARTAVRTSTHNATRAAGVAGALAAATAAASLAYCCGPMGGDDSITERLNRIEEQLNWMAVDKAGRTNQAFVFIKPHACNDRVAALVRDRLRRAGVSVVAEGDIDAATIDKDMLIDTHYGAIAAKAVKLDPSELNVPAKGKAAFQKNFGLSWDEAVASGKVYNAMQAAKKLGLSAQQMDAKWATLNRGTTLLKFGGGFYCGRFADDMYVMNGFYMNMRGVYTAPGAKIHWLTVEWPRADLSWADFRERVLGATDPSTAEKGSLRRAILDNYVALGLGGKPDTGNNGVHASASPFEALAERVNWTGATVRGDAFGRAMLAAGVPEETINAWSSDPQVAFGGKKGSLFDLLEDLDADTVLAKSAAIAAEN